MFANMLKALIVNGRIETTITKAKELRRHADKVITLAKKQTLAGRRQIIARLMVRYNTLTSKEARKAKQGDARAYNNDRMIEEKITEYQSKFAERQGGYTRIIKLPNNRVGDNASRCVIEFVQ
jgi:large subunit ribosomal protein L17